jgi:hypothetical protein
MELRDIVRINEKGLVADAVNLKMMDDPVKNLHLCEGFIFNYDTQKPKESTVGVLVKVQESFHGANHPNVHIVVQDYGKGKSHFALVMANFFKRPAGSAEVHGILHQIEMAVGARSSISEDLKNYKERNKPHLVIRLSGDQMTDLKVAFLKSLRLELEAAGATASIGQHLCADPLNFLQRLDEAGKQKAERYLAETQPNQNVETLIRELKNDNYALIHLVKEISREIHGHPFEFESDLDLEAILAAIVRKLCGGSNAHFAGVLILFDELLPYLQGWAHDPGRHGGSALQNLTNACENHKSKIALVTFSQVRPQLRGSVGVPLQSLNDYQKLTSRLEKQESRYEPRASLEIVIDNLIYQDTGAVEWEEFEKKWYLTLKSDSDRVFSEFVPTYQEQGWTLSDFYKHLGMGSFPLHPLTACLLANLEFTQSRTVIGFIKEDVKSHIEAEEAEFNGKPNYMYAYQLVEAFKSSLSNHSIYHDYQKARVQIQAQADADHIRVLESLFLYYTSGQKLTKKPDEEHWKILSAISGLSERMVRSALSDLCDKFHVLYYVGDSKLYRFYQGASPAEVSRLIDDEIGDKQSTLGELARYCEQLPFFAQISTITPESFVDGFELVGDDWQYTRIVIPIQDLITGQSIQGRLSSERGLVAHILYEQTQDRKSAYDQAQKFLAAHPENHRLLVAIPEEPVGDLLRVLKQKTALEGLSAAERKRFGEAYDQQLEGWAKTLSNRLENAVTRTEYYCIGIENMLRSDRHNPQELISEILRQNYRFVAPIARIDKMRVGSNIGNQVSSFIAKQLLLGDEILISRLPNKAFKTVIDGIFSDTWKLLVKTSDRYKLNPPEHRSVKKAWDEISNKTALGGAESREICVEEIWKLLSSPPFGYNELTFIVLFSAWLAAHRREVAFKGDLAIQQRTREATRTTNTATPISDWANTNVFDKPREFLSQWAPKSQNRLVRHKSATLPAMPGRCDYDEAKELLGRVDAFLGAGNCAPDQRDEAKRNKDELASAISRLDKWAAGIREFEKIARQADLNLLLSKVYSERKRYSLPETTTGKPAVSPSEDHRTLFRLVQDGLDSLVQTKIDELAAKARQVSSDHELGAYKNEIESIQRWLTGPLANFNGILETALQEASVRVDDRKREDAIKAVADEVNAIGNQIDANTSQNLCATKLERLDSLAQANPQLAEEEIFQTARRKVENCLETLLQQFGSWEQKLLAVTCTQEASALRDEINRQSNRYTKTDDKERVSTLLEEVERIWNELRATERAKENQDASFNEFRLIIERISNAELLQILEKYEGGQQKLNQLTRDYKSDTAFVSSLMMEWECAQDCICAKLKETTNEELHEIGQYTQRKAKLESAREIARLEEFAEFASQIAAAMERVETKCEALRLEQKDRDTLKQIEAYTTSHLNTIAALDYAEENVRRLRSELHRPEIITSDIQKVLLEIEGKRSRFVQQLEDLEAKINKAMETAELNAAEKEMLRAEAAFKGSSLSEKFDVLHALLRELRGTADLLATIGIDANKSHTIADCLRVKAKCEEVAGQISGSRFDGQIDELISQLEEKVKSIVGKLADFKERLGEGNLEQVKKLRQELSRCSNQYANSPYQEDCDRLIVEADEVERLLEFGSKQPNSIEKTNHLLADAQNMIDANSAEVVQKRGAEVLAALRSHRGSLLREEEEKAKETLEGFYQKWKKIETESELISKIRLGEEFMREVHQHKQSLDQYLPAEHQSDIDELLMAVLSALDSDRETQICVLFNQLPEEMKGRVYAKLGELIVKDRIRLNGQPETQPMAVDHV